MGSAVDRQIGRYKFISELGRGGMGIVYRAIDPAIGRMVAIKTVSLKEIGNEDETALVQRRFLREMRLAGSVSHPHIVSIHDAGGHDGIIYMVMELVEGRSLDRLLAAGSRFDVPDVCAVLRQIASALDYLHAKGIVHRDLKPANILIDRQEVAKLTDFGIARALSHPKLTRTGLLVGTPHYMSPEQLLGHDAEAASDQFALGVIAWQMLVGRRPFEGEDLASLTQRILQKEPSPIPTRLGVTAQAEQVLRRALVKDRNRRYPTCSNFVEALARTAAPVPTKKYPYAAAAAGLCVAVATLVLAPRPPQPSAASVPRTAATSHQPSISVKAKASGAESPAQDEILPHKYPARFSVDNAEAARAPTAFRVNSTPAGASVVVDHDASARCTTPCSLFLTPGRHALAATLASHRTALKIFNSASEPDVFLVLEPERGTLVIKTTPTGAIVFINGRIRPEITPAVFSLPPGTYALEVSHGETASGVFQIAVQDGETKLLAVELDGARHGITSTPKR